MMRNDPIEWARMCRDQAALTPDPKIAGLLLQLADQCDALAERLSGPDDSAGPASMKDGTAGGASA
jgi:hypothetical protein